MNNEGLLNTISLFMALLIVVAGGIFYIINHAAAFISYAFSTLIISFLFLRYNKQRLIRNSMNRPEDSIYPKGYVPQYQLYLTMFLGFLISVFAQAGMFVLIDLFSISYESLIYSTLILAIIIIVLMLQYIKRIS